MSESTTQVSASTATRQDYLRRHLGPFWLRPESALWYAHESYLVRKLLGTPMARPSLEFACFDATPTFVLLGGEFGIDFDVYSEVTWSRESHWQSFKDDYYNVSGQHASDDLDIKVRPSETFDVGLSWKTAHLEKAARLGLHERLVNHDPAGGPMMMFADNAFATIWAPNLYWVDDLETALSELRRILQPDGRLVTVLPDPSVIDHMLTRRGPTNYPAWSQDLDRGRSANFARQARRLEEWQATFKRAGLTVVRHEFFIYRIVLHVHDIGFRPMFPVFMNMYDVLRQHRPDDWRRLKEHWIERAHYFLAPLCDTEWMEQAGMERVYHAFQLTPTSRVASGI